MNFNPLAQLGGFDSDDDDAMLPPPPQHEQSYETNHTPAPPPPTTQSAPAAMAIPLMQANGRIARAGMIDGTLEDDSELSEAESDFVPEPVQFTVKHMKQQRQSVLAYNAGGPGATPIGIPDPKLQNEIVALNQKLQSLTVLLDKSRNKARQQAVDLEDAEDRVTQLENEVQELNDKVRQRDHALSNLEYELQRAQKKDVDVGVEKTGFSDKLKLFQSKIAANTLASQPPQRPLPRGNTPFQRSSSMVRSGSMVDDADGGLLPASTSSTSIISNPSATTTTATQSSPQQQKQTITIVDDTKIKELEKQLKTLRESLALKQDEIDELRVSNAENTTIITQPDPNAISQAEFVALGEEMASYQAQVGTLQAQCDNLESLLKQQQETIASERAALKESKDDWYIEEQRLLTMIDELHASIQQTNVDVREYKEQITMLQQKNQHQQQQIVALQQQQMKSRPTISLPPTPKSSISTQLAPTLEEPSEHHQPPQLPPVVAPDSDSDDDVAPPPPTTPRRSSAGVRPSLSADKLQPIILTPKHQNQENKPTPPALPQQQQQLEPLPETSPTKPQPPKLPPTPTASSHSNPPPMPVQVQSVVPVTAIAPAVQNGEVYEENVDDGELITKGLLTKLGLDAANKPSSKRHFFALFATKTQYSEYYGDHVKAACELRWGRQESDYTSYPYGATVTNAFVAANAINFLRTQGTNGQTLAAMVRPEDVGRLLVMPTVDGRYVLLMCRDSEKGTATGPERAVAWCDSVRHAVRQNAIALGTNPDTIFIDDDDDEQSNTSTPMISPQITQAPVRPIQLQQQQPQQPTPHVQSQQQQHPPPPQQQPFHRESTIAPLTPRVGAGMGGSTNDLRTSNSVSWNSSPAQTTPSLGPAPSPAHFMTRPLTQTTTQPVKDAPIPPMRGTLTKFIHNGKSWHTKHFFLTSTSGVIQWGDSPSKYKYHEFVKSVLRGQDKDLRIDPKAMKKANFSYNPDLMFSVQTTGKTLYLMAPTEESLSEWIDALERALFNQTHPR